MSKTVCEAFVCGLPIGHRVARLAQHCKCLIRVQRGGKQPTRSARRASFGVFLSRRLADPQHGPYPSFAQGAAWLRHVPLWFSSRRQCDWRGRRREQRGPTETTGPVGNQRLLQLKSVRPLYLICKSELVRFRACM